MVNPKALIACGVLVILTVILSHFYYSRLSPDAQKAQHFLASMPEKEILAVEIAPYTVSSLTESPVILSDRAEIKAVADAMRAAPGASVNHPISRWVAILRLRTAKQDFGGQVSETSNGQGTLFWYASQVEGGWHYGVYRVDALASVLEALVKKHGKLALPQT